MYDINEIRNKIIQGNVLEVLKEIPSESVNTIITSPPYWGLRDYGVDGQIGLEPTLDEYLDKLLKVTAELKRILRKDGVMFWNHGDSYCGSQGHFDAKNPKAREGKLIPDQKEYPKKCLYMQNYRLAMRMVDEQGWILRNVIIWHKPNHMPSSVKDRFTNAYEPVFFFVKNRKYWFDLDAVRVPHKEETLARAKRNTFPNPLRKKYLPFNPQSADRGEGTPQPHPLGKNPGDVWKPYAVQERVKEWVEYRNLPQIEEIKNYLNEWRQKRGFTIKEIEKIMNSKAPHHWFNGESYPSVEDWKRLKEILGFDDKYDEAMTKTYLKPAEKQNHPLGKNPGDVWEIPTQPFKDAHFATFPERLVERMIKAGCPKWICKKCGKPRERIVEVVGELSGEELRKYGTNKDGEYKGRAIKNYKDAKAQNPSNVKRRVLESIKKIKVTVGWTDCGCNAGWRPGIVLDPFMGSGTTALVALKNGCDFIGIELNPEYIEMAYRRIKPYLNQKRLIDFNL